MRSSASAGHGTQLTAAARAPRRRKRRRLMLWLAGGGAGGSEGVIGFPLWHQGIVADEGRGHAPESYKALAQPSNPLRIKPMTQLSRFFCKFFMTPPAPVAYHSHKYPAETARCRHL